MTGKALQTFSLVVSAVLATMLGTASAQAQNTNTTIQEGRVCINRTSQVGDSNDNATYQTCKVNINRTTQIGRNNKNQTGQFGRLNQNRTSQSRDFKRTSYKGAGSTHRRSENYRFLRGRYDRSRARNHGD